jgi:hypothetical protein
MATTTKIVGEWKTWVTRRWRSSESSAWRRALVWATICIGIYLLELLVFSVWTIILGVSFNVNTMSEDWLFGFYGLFILRCRIVVFALTQGKTW